MFNPRPQEGGCGVAGRTRMQRVRNHVDYRPQKFKRGCALRQSGIPKEDGQGGNGQVERRLGHNKSVPLFNPRRKGDKIKCWQALVEQVRTLCSRRLKFGKETFAPHFSSEMSLQRDLPRKDYQMFNRRDPLLTKSAILLVAFHGDHPALARQACNIGGEYWSGC